MECGGSDGELYYSWSSYNYDWNNPIRFIDVNGMWIEDKNGFHSESAEEAQEEVRKRQNNRKSSSRPEGMSEKEALSHVVSIEGKKYHNYTGNLLAQAANEVNAASEEMMIILSSIKNTTQQEIML